MTLVFTEDQREWFKTTKRPHLFDFTEDSYDSERPHLLDFTEDSYDFSDDQREWFKSKRPRPMIMGDESSFYRRSARMV